MYVSEMFCKVVVKNAMAKDNGAWDIALVRTDNPADNYEHYNYIVMLLGKSMKCIHETLYGLIDIFNLFFKTYLTNAYVSSKIPTNAKYMMITSNS